MKFLIFIFLIVSSFAQALSLEEILKMEQRPSLEMNLLLDENSAAKAQERIFAWDIADNQAIYNLYERLILEILNRIPDRDAFLMSRDMDDLFDAFTAAVLPNDSTGLLARHVHHLEVSRRVALASTDRQLNQWMLLQGFDMDKVVNGEQRVFVLDTGYKSKIFNAINALAFRTLAQVTTEPARGLDLLANMETQLLSSWHTNTSVPQLKSDLQRSKYRSLKDVADLFVPEKFFFDEIIPSEREWHQMGINSADGRDHWLINNLERAHRHWRPRILKLNQEGTGPELIEDENERDARVDKRFVLYYQRRLYNYFTSDPVQRRLRPAILDALERLRKIQGQENATVTESRTPGSILEMPTLGAKLATPQGRQLEVLELVHDGKDAKIFKVLDQANRHFVLKVAATESEEHVDSINRTRRRLEKLKDLNVGVSQIVEFGDNYILKEWVEGQTGLSLLESLDPDARTEWLPELIKLVSAMADRGIYVSNLSPSNIIYNQEMNQWTIIDSSSVQEMAPDTAREKFRDSLSRRWIKRARSKDCELILEELVRW